MVLADELVDRRRTHAYRQRRIRTHFVEPNRVGERAAGHGRAPVGRRSTAVGRIDREEAIGIHRGQDYRPVTTPELATKPCGGQ